MKKLLLSAVVLLCLISVPAAAQEEVEVGSYILNIGRYDINHGSYTIDFYLWFVSEDGVGGPTFEFVNGRADSIDLIINKSNYKFYRIEAELYEDAYLGDYPMDGQKISIKLEDKKKTVKDLVYVVDKKESGISPELNILGWAISESDNWVEESHYPNWNETYSRYVHSISIARPHSTILKILIPVLFISITAWLCFFIPIHMIQEKLTLCGTALLSAVAFHIFVTATLPTVGYLTMADKIMMSLYAMLVFSLIAFVMIDRHYKDHKKRGSRMNMLYSVLSVLVPMATLLIIFSL